MSLSIVPAVSSRDVTTFLRVPNLIYRGMPGFATQLLLERRSLLDPRKGSFFHHGKVGYWLAMRDGQPVGRISAQIDHAQPPGTFNDAGLFGCFDAVDDSEVTARLLETAEGWLRAEGRPAAIGPFALNMNSEPGLLVEGQTEAPLTMVSWHPRYLEKHLTAAGYAACRDLHYWRYDITPASLAELMERKRMSNRLPGVTLRPIDMQHLERDIEIIRQVHNDAWQHNWGFVPLQPSDVAAIATEMRPFVKPEFGVIMGRAGKPIGVALVFPNLAEMTRDIGETPTLAGWLKLAYRSRFHHFRSLYVIMLGVVSELRGTVSGAHAAMMLVDTIIRRFENYGEMDWGEAGWVLDINLPLQKILQRQGFRKTRALRIFEKRL